MISVEEQIVKIQKRKTSMFVTIPKEYTSKIKNSTHLKVRENDYGNLEYEVMEKKEVE